MAKGVAEEYTSSLADLTVNSKPLINMLTMLAEDYIEQAPSIVRAVEAHLQKVTGEIKLPVLYLIDSIVKNVGKKYVALFTQNIVSTFCTVFEQVDEKIRSQMFKLRQTWNDVFPPKKLYALDARVNAIDPAWPITANPPHGRIHVNPKFLNPVPATTFTTPETTTPPITDGAMREELLKKQKELLELQKRKVELELLQTKAILEEQQKKLENQTASFKPDLPSNSEKSKNIQELPEPFSTTKSKTPGDGTHDNKAAFENSRVRDPRLRLKKINNKIKPNGPTFNIPERVKPSKSNLFGEDNIPQFIEENHISVNNDFNCVKRTERSDRRTERRHRKYKEHKSRPKSVSEDHGTIESNRSKNILNEITKHKEFSPTMVHQIANKTNLSSGIKISEFKLEETGKLKIKSSPSKIRIRSKTKDKIKKKTAELERRQSPVILSQPKEEEPTKNLSLETQSMIPIKDESALHGISSLEEMDISMDVDEKVPYLHEENKAKELTPLPLKEEVIVTTPSSKTEALVISSNNIGLSKDPTLESSRDIDLRLLPQSKTEPEQPPEKKTKAEIQKLFGEEDVDLRKFPPPTPPTPPPPVISHSFDLNSEVESTNGWANIKRTSCDTISPNKSPKKMKSSYSCPKVSFFNKVDEDTDENNSLKFSEHESEGRNRSLSVIMNQAEEQLKNGTITFTQYNHILKNVMSVNETTKLHEAMLKDEMEMDDSPSEIAGSSGTPELPNIDKDDIYHSPDIDEELKLPSGASDIPMEINDGQLENIKSSNEGVASTFSELGNDINSRKRAHFKDQFQRGKEPRPRYYNPDPFFMGNNKTWMMRPPPNFVHRPHRKEVMFNRFQPYQNFNRPPFDSKHLNYTQPTRMRNIRQHHDMSLPPADPNVLEMITNDPMTYVNVGGMSKEIRFYGENAIIMLDWDDPRDLMFQPGSRRVFIDGVDILTLQFNSQYREITLTDGLRIRIRLGAPTRELFIDGRFYDVKFGGPPVEINLEGRTHLIQLEGPLPFLKIGPTKRTDLVAGKVNLIVDGKIENIFPLYLDAKPQKFEIENVPFIIRFVEALQTIVINGQPFKIQFGGLPVPIFFRGEKHFLRLTSLPSGITAGYVNILNMEGGRLPTPPPPRTPPPPKINGFEPSVAPPGFMKQSIPNEIQGIVRPVLPVPFFNNDYQLYNGSQGSDQPVDVLTSLMAPPAVPNFSQIPSQNYIVEPSQENANISSSAPPTSIPNINVGELYKKLVAIGVVPPVQVSKEKEICENNHVVKPVDFSKPETLKVRQQGLVNKLYSGIQCSSCGVRFAPEQTVKHSQHLDWHFRQNRRERHSCKIALSRKWNYDVADWIQYQEIEDIEDRAQSWFEMQDKKADTNEKEEKEEPTVPAKGFGENPFCTVCRDKFDQFFNEEKEEWQLKMALCVDEKLYHPLCYKDEQESEGKNVGEMLMNIQEELHSIETIVIDDSVANGSSEDEIKIDGDKEMAEENKKIVSEKTEEINHQTKVDDEIFEVSQDLPLATKELEEEPSNQLVEDPIHQVEGSNDAINLNPEVNDVEMLTEDPVQESEKKGEASDSTMRDEDSDDDILEIEVLKPNIESYEILDDEDEQEGIIDQFTGNENTDSNLKEILTDIDTSDNESEDNVTVKLEKIDLVNLNLMGNTSHVTETISLDGNSEFSAPKMVIPKKIKINISSIMQKNVVEETPSDQQNNTSNNTRLDESTISYVSEPLPPGEELYPAHVKPNLVGRRLADVGAIRKGKELSGLCSLM